MIEKVFIRRIVNISYTNFETTVCWWPEYSQIFLSKTLTFRLIGEKMRMGERRGGEGHEEGRGQKWGIYMSGAIGYGELSWINSLFTLAGRLLSEAAEVGASGDPALCYGERRAGKRSPEWLAGMSPGTMLQFSTTAASIIIRGRSSLWRNPPSVLL